MAVTPLATLVAPLTQAQWFSVMLADAASLDFPTTTIAWQPGGVYATLLQQAALGVADNNQLVANVAQGAFISTAPNLAPPGGTSPAPGTPSMRAEWMPWKCMLCGCEPPFRNRIRTRSPSVARMVGPGTRPL